MRETRFRSLGQENSLEKLMATHFSTLAWKIPWTEEPGGLQSMGSHRIWHHRATSQLHSHIFINQNRNHYNQHIFANRNKFVYSFNVKICALGFHGLLESIFCLLLVVEAFSLQKIIKLFEEVVVGWQEVRWIWHIRQNFVAQFVQLLRCWLCSMQLGIVMEQIGPTLLNNAGCRHCIFRCISDVIISPGFRKL